MEELITLGIGILIYIAIAALVIWIEILIAKYLIRYGVEYYFRLKQYNDNRDRIDEIQADIIKDHPEKE